MISKATLKCLAALVSFTTAISLPRRSADTKHWPGWGGISHVFFFGDSYTDTTFNISGPQPSRKNPFGNPPYPGYTATNMPLWSDFLITTWNDSFVEAINFAYGGATVDSALIAPYTPLVKSFRDQIHEEYLPKYSKHPSFFDWKEENTLFATFFGINDIDSAYQAKNASTIFAKDIAEYASLVDVLYQTGARNFLFMNVPAINRAPETTVQGKGAERLEELFIVEYNANITKMAANLSSTYHDAKTFVFDTNAIFNRVLDDPCSYPETCLYKNTTKYCREYQDGTNSWFTFKPKCGIPVDEYFWLNTLHPTFRIFNVTAKAVAEQLKSSTG